MHKLCKYTYVAGPKKGKQCDRFIRGKTDDVLCYQHKKYAKKSETVEEIIDKKTEIIAFSGKKGEVKEDITTPVAVTELKIDSTSFCEKKASCKKNKKDSDSSDFSISDSSDSDFSISDD